MSSRLLKTLGIGEEHVLSLPDYLGMYYNIYPTKEIVTSTRCDKYKKLKKRCLLHKTKIAHKDINFEGITRYPNDYLLSNKSDIYTCKIILVEDCFGNIAGYKNPLLEEEELETRYDYELRKGGQHR